MQSLGIGSHEEVDSPDNSDVPYQKWVGKDYYNPFVKDFIELHKPHEGKPSCLCTAVAGWYIVRVDKGTCTCINRLMIGLPWQHNSIPRDLIQEVCRLVEGLLSMRS